MGTRATKVTNTPQEQYARSNDSGDIGCYKIHWSERLGKGTFGEVFKATSIVTGNLTAAKKMVVPALAWRNTYEETFRQKIQVLKDVQGQHPNIIKVFNTYDLSDKNQFWIMSELCKLGNLDTYMKVYDVNKSHIIHIMQQVVSALIFLHSQTPSIVHANIKPQNVLITTDDNIHVVRLSDIGNMDEIVDLTNLPSNLMTTNLTNL